MTPPFKGSSPTGTIHPTGITLVCCHSGVVITAVLVSEKTKEMSVDIKKMPQGVHAPIHIDDDDVEEVSNFTKFLKVHLTDYFTWTRLQGLPTIDLNS